ncbi:hypothetical protein M3Y99_01057500 [Aphelenchoides fujianensis]|nr:hypothetical protein M3Y99_01057500 [Aphelenchoides fujianensis]
MVGCVLPAHHYDKLLQNGTIRASDFLPVYHGFDEDMVHNYFSKPYEPEFEGPVFYSVVRKEVHEASLPLWTLDGQPVDSLGHQKYDTIYTTDLEKVLLPDKQNYVVYRRLGYIWPIDACYYRLEVARKSQISTKGKNGTHVKGSFAQDIHKYLIPLYQFYHEEQQTFYYTSDLNDANTSRDNYVTRYELFVGGEMYEEAQRSYGLKFKENTTLGYVALSEGYFCKGHYRLDIVVQHEPPMIDPPVNWTAPVGAVPPPYSASYTLSFNQTFYAW